MIDLMFALALFVVGRLLLALGGRGVRALRRFYDRSRNGQSYRLGRQVQGVRVHGDRNAR